MNKKSQKDNFNSLADHIAKEAMASGTAFVDKVAALKALTSYYQAVHGRKNAHDDDEDEGAPSMGSLSAHIHTFQEHPNGSGPTVRGRGRA